MALFDRLGAPPARAGWERLVRLWGPRLDRLLPSTLFGRSLLIIVTPVLLMQGIAAGYFYDSHWKTITERLAEGVAGEIGLVIEELDAADTPVLRRAVFDRAARSFAMGFAWRPGAVLSPQPALGDYWILQKQLDDMMDERVGRAYVFLPDGGTKHAAIHVQLDDGVLEVSVPWRRLFSSTSQVFFLWSVGSGVILFSIALLFMRGQLRPIRRLARAADRFGKGREVPEFRPQGAAEVRQAAMAFQAMRERLQRLIGQRMAMLSGVSHDLRTPLTRMKLQLAMLGDGPDIEELRADVAEMETMIDGYLAFARGEAGEAPQRTDLSALLDEVVAAARREGARIACDLPGPIVLPLRPQAMRRCLANLLSNARRHAASVFVSVERQADGVEVLVDDDGPGIPEAQREEVFRAFHRLDTSRNAATGGSGLGLTIARDIARAHGGDIRLSRSPQGGLRCAVRLPA